MKNTKHLPILIFIAFLATSYLQHSQYFKIDIQGIHAWRQSQTMWNIRNFVRHDNNILNPRINRFNGGQDNLLRYELPVMQWTIAQFERHFGEKISYVRIGVFIIGLFSILGIFLIVQLMLNDWLTSGVTAVLFQYSPVFYYYTINPIPDNLALCAGLFYIFFILKHQQSKKYFYVIIAGIFLLLATLSKLPYLMFSVVSIYFFVKKVKAEKKIDIANLKYGLIQLALIIPAIIWYKWVMPSWSGNPVLTGGFQGEFIINEYIEIAKYHITEMFPKILVSMPIWILIGLGIYKFWGNRNKYGWIGSLIVITFCYLIFEFKPIGTVHDYYMMPFLSWLFCIVALGVFCNE